MELVFYLTNKCNMQCKYCYQGAEKKTTDLSFDIAKNVLDNVSQKEKNISMGFFGGEPLLRKDLFYEINNYCKEISKKSKTKFGITITTNGTLIDEEFVKFCKKNDIKVGISIDGEKESHDINRLMANGKSTYDSTLRGLDLCVKEKLSVMALPVVCLNNVDKMASNLEFFINHGVKEVTFNFNYFDNWDDDSLLKLKKQYEKISDIYIRELKKGNRIAVYPIDTKMTFLLVKNRQCVDRCNLNRTCVDSDGSFYPCIQFVGKEKYKIGDYKTGVNNNKRYELIKTRNTSKVVCDNCALKRYCASGCGCIRFSTTNDIVEVTPLVCETEKIYINTANDLIAKINKENIFNKFIWTQGVK